MGTKKTGASTEQDIPPCDITPLHKTTHPRLVASLASDMRDNGWEGRPLLVIKAASGYIAWTGTHRIAAAIEAELPTVPCYIINEKKLTRHGFDAVSGHVMDYERHAIMVKVGDSEGIRLMYLESAFV